MPTAKTRAFVLGSSTFSEQDRLVHLLTADQGIMKAIAPGSMKARNRFGSLFELFTEGEFQYYWKENRELITISNGDIIHSYFNMVSQPENIFYFYLLADVLVKFVPYLHHDKRLYRLVNTILENRSNDIDITLLVLYYLIWVLRIEGMMFNPQLCYNCYSTGFQGAWFKDDFQGILCPACHTTEKLALTLDELNFIKWTEKKPPKDLPQWLDKLDIPKMIRAFTKKIEYHAETPLKTAQYLKEFR